MRNPTEFKKLFFLAIIFYPFSASIPIVIVLDLL